MPHLSDDPVIGVAIDVVLRKNDRSVQTLPFRLAVAIAGSTAALVGNWDQLIVAGAPAPRLTGPASCFAARSRSVLEAI